MTPEIQDLLKLLDEPNDAFESKALRLLTYLFDAGYITEQDREEAFRHKEFEAQLLAALAFRLRDRAVKESGWDWGRTVKVVREHCHSFPNIDWFIDGWITYAQPKHYIVAALIAKRLKGNKDE